MQKLSSGFLLVLLLATTQRSWADPSVNVPLDHWGYGFLERCEARGILRGIGNGIKPFSRMEMARALVAVEEGDETQGRLTGIDREQLRLLMREFADECASLKRAGQQRESPSSSLRPWRGPGPQLRYQHEQGEAVVELLFRQQTDLFSGMGRDETERIFRTRLGGTVRGHLQNRVGFYISFQQSVEQGSRSYFLRDDVFERRIEVPQLKGNRVDFHEGKAYLTFALPFCDVEFGKDDVSWGPGPKDQLGLSDNAPSFDMLRLRAQFGVFKLVSIAGALRSCPDRPDSPLCQGMSDPDESYIVNHMSRLLDREKYLAAHRLEAALAPWIDLGFQEVVVYGDRGPEVTYLNPVMFYWAAQSYLGDKDNLMMGFDVDIHPGKGWRMYLAYVVDDLKKLKVFSNDFANKFSLQTGLQWVDPLGLKNLDLWAEYVRIEPWIYTHKFPINTFRHFDSPLGHALGPNSDCWQGRITHRLSRDLSLITELSRTRHGDNELLADGSVRNVGGDLHLGWRPGDERDSKKFLDGRLSRRTRLGARVELRVWPDLLFAAAYGYEWNHNVPLPPRWGDNIALTKRTGYGDGHQQQFQFDLRFHYF